MDLTHAVDRARDGAFFEDWSAWRSLGGRLWEQRGLYRRRTYQASYHCLLMRRLPVDRRPGFEIAVPQNIRIARMLKAIPGAYEPKLRRGIRVSVDIWYVPAESWAPLKKILPAIAKIVAAQYGTS